MKAALVYAARLQWRVLPVQPGGKRPILKDWTSKASSDSETIKHWIEKNPNANIGINPRGFFVLDVDPKNGGVDTLKELEAKHGPLPETATQRTPSGGFHYLFRGNIATSASKLGRGLDTRGETGQFVVAPSKTDAGKYEWVRAPWDFEIAEPPAWLVEALKPRAAEAVDEEDTGERGFFPAASPEVLEAARETLERHGPAIEGSGGDHHTFRAAAILRHDFALSEVEAWPLFVQWNETCQPPWSEEELRTKFANGEEYGTAPYGIKRSMDAVVCVQKAIADWKGGDGVKLVQDCRKFLRAVTDPTVRAQCEKDLHQATGFKPKEMGLPKGVVHVEVAAGEIQMTTELAKVADLSTQAIKRDVFQRNGILCEVVTGPRTFISDLQVARIRDLMSRRAKYLHADEKGSTYQPAPEPVASIIHARRMHTGIRVIDSVTTSPIFLEDGSILQQRGYNATSRVYLDPSVSVEVPESPTREDALAAVALFRDLLGDFKFQGRADFSTWLAALLTPLVKASIKNAPAPLFVFSASNAGAGKTLLAEVLARIVTGVPLENSSYAPKDSNEWLKKLTSYVKAGSSIRVFDNVNGQFGDEALDRLVTSSVWSDRVLGASDAPPLPVVTTWVTTGNNSEPVGDTIRRVLVCRIEVNVDRPQELTGFKRPLLADYAESNRAQLLTAALTLLRAYHLADRPDQRLPSWGSFVRWSELVRGALVWAGLPDPFETQQRVSADVNEPENEAHDFWISIIETTNGTTAAVADLANQRGAREILGLRNDITPFLLRRFVNHFVDRPRLGKRIRRTGTTYHVEAI